jgi:hypothetical protein
VRNEQECIAEAERCERQARLCGNAYLASKLIKIACKWRELAVRAATPPLKILKSI